MTHDEMILVITHHKNGGKVQCKHQSDDNWSDFIDCVPRWDFWQFKYRAKPEPLAIWAEIINGHVARYSSRETKPCMGGVIKKFVEVTE